MAVQHAVGIDVGGTKIAGAIVNVADGSWIEAITLPTQPGRGGKSVLADAGDVAQKLTRSAEERTLGVLGVGICIAELVDLEQGINSAQTIDWRGLEVASSLGVRGPVVVESDVRAGAIAEHYFGVADQFESFVFVSVGTGVSHTFVLSGRPWRGAHGNAIIAATGPITSTCPHCGREHSLVLEDEASGAGIEAAYSRLAADGTTVTAKEVISMATDGAEIANEVVLKAANSLASTVGYLVNVLDPHGVVLGGGLGSAGGLYWDLFAERVRHHIVGDLSRDTPIVRSALGQHGPMIGAALAVASA